MSNIIGYVSKQTGNATLTKINGEVVELGIFSQIHKNDLVESLDGAQLEIILTNGNVLTIDGQRTLLLDETVYEKKAFDADEVSVKDVNALQEGDISELEDTEAGESAEGTSQNIGDAFIGSGNDHGAAFAEGLGTDSTQGTNGFNEDLLEDGIAEVGRLSFSSSSFTQDTGTGTSGDTGTPSETFSSSSFVDSLVGGVSYVTSSGLTGLTSADGEFNYREGDSVTFNVGGVVIGTVSSENLHDGFLFLQDIAGVELSDVNSNYVENMAIFLQLLDADGDTSNGITISAETREAFADYTLNIEASGKAGISDALAQVGIEFTPESEMSDDGNNIFETVALEHVAEYIEQFAGDRAPDGFDERVADTVAFNDAPVEYNYTDGAINFDARDLLANTRGQQVLDENLEVKDVKLHADFANVGVLSQNSDGSYTIVLNKDVSPYDLEGLKLDFTITDWTASLEVTSTSLDTNKSHLSVEFSDGNGEPISLGANGYADVSEGVGSVYLNVASALTFDTDQRLIIDFPSNDGAADAGGSKAEWADDVLIPLHYSNDGGETWTQMHGDFAVVLAAGSSELMIRVDVFDDAKIELNELFEMTLSGDNVYTEDLSFNIADNDFDGSDNGLPHMSIGFVLAVEGEEFAEFTVSIDKTSLTDITVDYSTFDFSAVAGEDFTAVTGTLTILAGETSATIQVPITDDALIEDTEIAFVNITNPSDNVVIDDMQASLRIYDNDMPEDDKSTASITPVDASTQIFESDSEVIFNVNLDKAFDIETVVDFNVVTTMAEGTYGPYSISFDGGTTWSEISESGRVRIPAGEGVFQVRVNMNDDDGLVEANETMSLEVSSYALIGTVTSEVVILNDDVAPDAPVVNEIGLTNDNTPALGGTAQPGSKVHIVIGDAEVVVVLVGDDGVWTYTPTELGEGEHTISVVAVDPAGNESEATSIVVDVDTIAPDAPVLTNFVDVNGDYSQVFMTGIGEPGATITLYNKSGHTTGGNETNPDGTDSPLPSVIVNENGTWSIDISNLSDTPENDNEFFTVVQTDAAGNVSSTSDAIHYWHGNWSNVSTEVADDIVLMGEGDDTIRINDNDANDHLMVDGGNDNDTAIFNKDFDEYTITTDADGHTIVSENADTDSDGNGQGDVNELRNFETIKFADGEYDVNDGSFNYYPEAQDDSSVTVEEDSSVLIDVLANDSDAGNDALTIQSVTANEDTHGTVEIVDGQVLFTPDTNYYGPASFDYTVSDGTGFSDTATVNIEVTQVQYEGLTDLGGDANGTPVSFTISGDHYTPDENTVTGQEDVGEGSPKYQIFINGEPFGDVQDVSANRGYVGEDGKMHRDSGEFEVVTFKVPEGTDINSVTIKFLNDKYDGVNDNDNDGIYGEDRNLFVDSMNIGGTVEADGSITGGTTYQAEDKDVAQYLKTNGNDASGREIMPWAGDMTFYPKGVVIEAPVLDLVDSSDTGISSSDNITSDDTPVISVTLGAATATGDTITISVDGVGVATHVITVADWRAGTVEVQLPQIDNGTHEITAVVSNDEMSSEASSVESITIDTGINSGNAEPITAALADTSNSGSKEDSTTNDNTPTIVGQTEAGALVEIIDADGNVIASVIAGDDGSYEVTTPALEDGENDLTVSVTDEAGNSEETDITITVDTVGPDAAWSLTDTDESNLGVAVTSQLNIDTSDGTTVTSISMGGLDYHTSEAHLYNVSDDAMLMSQGQNVVVLNDGMNITGTIDDGATTVFTVQADATGEMVFTQFQAIEHPQVDGIGEANPDESLRLGFEYSSTDIAGNTTDAYFSVNINDSEPTITQTQTINVSEDSMEGFTGYGEAWEGDTYSIITQAEMLAHLNIEGTDTEFTVTLADADVNWTGGIVSNNSTFVSDTLNANSNVNDEMVVQITQELLNKYPNIQADTGAQVGDFYFDHVDFDALSEGEKAKISFDVVVTDADGDVSNTQRVDVEVTGTNDAPIIVVENGVLSLNDNDATPFDAVIADVDDMGLSNAFTVSVDAMITEDDNWAAIVEKVAPDGHNDFTIAHDQGKLIIELNDDDVWEGGNDAQKFVIGDTADFIGEMHTYTMSYDAADGGVINFYVDGVLVSTFADVGPFTSANEGKFIVGGDIDNTYPVISSDPFTGTIDNVQVYNTAVTAAQALILADNSATLDNGLVLHYDFNGENPLENKAGDNYNGSIVGGAVTGVEVQEDTATLIASASDVDGTINLTQSSADHGTLSMDADGNITYTPDENYNGTDLVSVTVTDDAGESTTEVINVIVNPANDAPEATDSRVSVSEDGVINGQINGSDVDGDTLTYALAAGTTAPEGFVLNTDGSYTFDADSYDSLEAGASTAFEIEISVTDGSGESAEAVLSVDVNGVNNDLTYISETAGYSNVVGYYEVDANGLPLSPAVVSIDNQNGLPGGLHLNDLNPDTNYGFFILANGANEVDADSVITFDTTGATLVLLIDGVPATHNVFHDTPSFNADGKDHFVFESDGEGGTNIRMEDLNGLGDADFVDVVLNVNFEMSDKIGDDVQAKNDSVSTVENQSILIDGSTLLANDRDGTGEALFITGVQATANTHGTVELANKVSFSDDFNDNDISDWTEISFNDRDTGRWEASNGSVGERSDAAKGILAHDMGENASSTDYSVSADVYANTGNTYNNGVGLVFGYTDANNYFKASWDNYSVSYDADGRYPNPTIHKDMTLTQVVDGVSTVLDIVDRAELPNNFNLEVTVNDNGIVVSVDGTEMLTSTQQPSLGTIGLWTYDNDHGMSYDNVEVTSSTAGTEIIYTPEDGYNGDASFTYTISDGVVGSDTATVHVHVSDLPEIVNIVDTNSDYSNVILSGTGEPGATITLQNKSGSTSNGNATNPDGEDTAVLPSTTVLADGTWSVDISNLEDTPLNDNEFFSAIQTEANGTVSQTTGNVHYWHGTWSSASTEAADDYVMMGNGNDRLRINADDANNALVVDGGNGTDKAIFNGAFSSFAIVAETGTVIITEANGDVNELRNFETVQFSDGNYDVVSETFTILAPVITDITDTNGDFSEVLLHGTGTTAGNTITVLNHDNTTARTTTVQADGTWILDISNTPKGGDWAFTAQESDATHSSDISSAVHYAHNDLLASNDDAFDDFVFKGEGDDSTRIDTNDSNDFYVYDGGNGIDTLILSEDRENYEISKNLNNEIVITNIGSGVQAGDVVIARNTEIFDFNNLKALSADDLFNGQVLEQTGAVVTELGKKGPNDSNGHNPSDINTQEFDFGSSYAGLSVTLTFNSEAVGTWDQGLSYTNDTFTISANGDQLDQINYDKAYDADNTWTDSHSYTFSLDAQGKAEVLFDVSSTGTDEKVSLTDITVTFDENSAVSDANGYETLLMNDSIDFSALTEQASNIDKVDLTEGTFDIGSISVEDVFNLTDADNTLTILKDETDTVEVSNEWKETSSGSGVYTATTDDSYELTLKIETELPVG